MTLRFTLIAAAAAAAVGVSTVGCTTSGAANASCEALFAAPSVDATLTVSATPSSATYIDGVLFRYPAARSGAVPEITTVANVASGAAKGGKVVLADVDDMVAAAARAAAPQSLDIVVFPEAFLYDGDNAEFVPDMPPYGPQLTACVEAANKHNVHVVCPLYELITRNGSQAAGPTFNTALMVARNGSVLGRYRKMYPVAEGVEGESGELGSGTLPGNLGVPVFDLDGVGRVAILTCWDMSFPDLWMAAWSQGAELVLWPAAAKGAHPVDGYAQIYNMFISADGHGQFYDRTGVKLAPDAQVNYTLSRGSEPTKEVTIFVKTLDLDSTVVFTGGPSTKKHKWEAFLGKEMGAIQVTWKDDVVAEWSNIAAVDVQKRSVRTALREAGIETRREEQIRNRKESNRLRYRSTYHAH